MTPRCEWSLDTRRLAHRVLVFGAVGSTNDIAASLASDPANDGLAILADEQTAGRGQHGRRWQCPPGAGILLSVLLFPPPHLRRPAILTAWAAVAVCETILDVANLQAKIKWPNDVLIRGRKVCGILIETRNVKRETGSEGIVTIAGIGLNVNQAAADFQGEELSQAGSLASLAGHALDRDEVARRLLLRLDAEYDRLCQGDLATLESCWKWRLGLLGKQVTAECHDGTHTGRLLDVGWNAVELELPDGRALTRVPEAVRQLRSP